ncbi:MAG: tRNA pseudouridine(38-40) synthase TruA [Peptococcia bacterium]
MRNIKMTVAYDGTLYHGFQKQRGTGLSTIQESLEYALSVLTQEEIVINGSGRTDAGVHALGQVINFQTNSKIAPERFPLAVNSLLPKDIRVLECENVELDFHARFDAKQKTYCYKIYNKRHMSPFWRLYAYHVPVELDVASMQAAARLFEGDHDFRGFCAKGTTVTDYTRTIYNCQVNQEGDMIIFLVTGNGFLWNMVRIMVGTVLEIGLGKRPAEDVVRLLTAGERNLSGMTVPPHGLYLVSVEY